MGLLNGSFSDFNSSPTLYMTLCMQCSYSFIVLMWHFKSKQLH